MVKPAELSAGFNVSLAGASGLAFFSPAGRHGSAGGVICVAPPVKVGIAEFPDEVSFAAVNDCGKRRLCLDGIDKNHEERLKLGGNLLKGVLFAGDVVADLIPPGAFGPGQITAAIFQI